MGIKYLERHLVLKYHDALHRYIQTKMEFWTSHPWVWSTDMPSKSCRSSNKRSENLGHGTLTTKAKKGRPQPTKQRIEQRWIVSGKLIQATRKEKPPERQRKILGSGATSIRALGITLSTAAQIRCWWPK
jgi:hypothetical protein